MNMVLIELAIGEANVLRQLIDMAVRSRGIEVAQVGLVLDKRIADAMEAAINKATEKQAEEARGKIKEVS